MNRAHHIVVVGGGPAGLMAAEVLRAQGCEVDLYDRMGSVGRKILIAGKGGLNLTHSEPFEPFVGRYREAADWVRPWLQAFDAQALRDWARGLGVETRVGSSGRVFPLDLKAAPLLRGWVRRLRESGVRMHMGHRLIGIDGRRLRFQTDGDPIEQDADAVVLALGGGSWARLGSDGAWVQALRAAGVEVTELAPANCGFECSWPGRLQAEAHGLPVKPVAVEWLDAHGERQRRQGEFVLTAHGVEGSLFYAIGADLRAPLRERGACAVWLDLFPGIEADALRAKLARARPGESLGTRLRKRLALDGGRLALVHACLTKEAMAALAADASTLKALPLPITATRPLDEAISSAGGVCRSAVDEHLMLRALPGVFCAGEMLDWEAPTGGYLLTACFASGRAAARGALDWLGRTRA